MEGCLIFLLIPIVLVVGVVVLATFFGIVLIPLSIIGVILSVLVRLALPVLVFILIVYMISTFVR